MTAEKSGSPEEGRRRDGAGRPREGGPAAVVGPLLAARFVLELGLLAAFATWGFSLDGPRLLVWVAGFATPVLVALVWGLVLSPRARVRASLPVRVATEVLLFAGAAVGLVSAGHPVWAAILVGGEAVVLTGLMTLGQPPGSESS